MWVRDSSCLEVQEQRKVTSFPNILWPHLPSPSLFHIPFGKLASFGDQIPKTNGIFGVFALAIPPFRQALSSAPHLSSLKSLQRLPCLQPPEMLSKEYHLSHLPLCTPLLFLHFTCHHVTFYMILYLLILFLH